MSTTGEHVPLPVLWQRLSPERMQPYVDAADGDDVRALRLYEWNIAISGALFESLGTLEVLLRNALHAALTRHHEASGLPGEWYDDPEGVFTERAREDIDTARRRLLDRGRSVSPGRLVAELTFGFWRFLLAKTYEHSLWTHALATTFSGQPRRDAHARLARLNDLRNRIAHHEPVHARRLVLDYRDLLSVAGSICSDSARWIDRTSRVRLTLALRP